MFVGLVNMVLCVYRDFGLFPGFMLKIIPIKFQQDFKAEELNWIQCFVYFACSLFLLKFSRTFLYFHSSYLIKMIIQNSWNFFYEFIIRSKHKIPFLSLKLCLGVEYMIIDKQFSVETPSLKLYLLSTKQVVIINK